VSGDGCVRYRVSQVSSLKSQVPGLKCETYNPTPDTALTPVPDTHAAATGNPLPETRHGPLVTHQGRLVTKQLGLFHFGLSVDIKVGSFLNRCVFSPLTMLSARLRCSYSLVCC
jgi:hypothetical protein